MKIPRPSGGSRQSNGVGKIFIKYEDSNGARKALQALAGRKFQDRTVVTTYFSEVGLDFSFCLPLFHSFRSLPLSYWSLSWPLEMGWEVQMRIKLTLCLRNRRISRSMRGKLPLTLPIPPILGR